MRQIVWAWLLLAGACHAEPEFGGQFRAQWAERQAASNGPLADANRLVPGIAAPPRSAVSAEAELRASGQGITAVATLQGERAEGGPTHSRAWFNELNVSGGGDTWQFSAGKKIVAWDVGYGFRPNDVVQQETRRTLLSVTPEGRPLLMAERFDADTALSLVLVNPTHNRSARGAREPALALRVYQRAGAADWFGFARLGAGTGGSVGAALAWVASDSLELRASLRLLHRADGLHFDPHAEGLVPANPWRDGSVRHPLQALIGGTWTNAQQLSLLAEAWWDGTALADGEWNGWQRRNMQLARLAGLAPPQALAGNLAWQGSAFNAAANLRRANLFVRASWQHEKWQPSIDLLYTPADAGQVLTASLGWQGDRVRLDAGVRRYGGPSGAVLAQVPTRRLVYAAVTWAF
jgi:hypothetical protein